MVILKCKMCGGDIQINEEQTFGTCGSCGSTMTFPKIEDDRKANSFNRANRLRRLNDFDKAIIAYERILNDDDSNSEAHWGVALSRYGIEYVEDPRTGARIPTCHRMQTESILSDADYLAAIEHASDSYTRSLYEKEAKHISEMQKRILAISSKEELYEVFICYKETSDAGTRTKDSKIAQDIYYQLTNEGFKVFFSRISLEDKLGQQYEPYIFAALTSSKVMVIVGTSSENFNSVWVKNEWSRYLGLIKKDRTKLLVPCYRDMDPYDLPEELSNLQAQDLGKIGFIQDLVRGIRKTLDKKNQKTVSNEITTAAVSGSIADSLLMRAYMFLEDGNFKTADEYFERVLDSSPKEAKAYIGKLLVERQIRNTERLTSERTPLDKSDNYGKILRFSDEKEKEIFSNYNQIILNRLEAERIEEVRRIEERCIEEKRIEEERIEAERIEEVRRIEERCIEEKHIEEERIEEERIEEENRCLAEEKHRLEEKRTIENEKRYILIVSLICIIVVSILLISGINTIL